MARIVALWAFGVLAGLLLGGLLGSYIGGKDEAWAGALGGAFTFACVRLWLTKPPNLN